MRIPHVPRLAPLPSSARVDDSINCSDAIIKDRTCTFLSHITACMTINPIGGYHKLEVGTYLPKADSNRLSESCQWCRAIKNSPSGAGPSKLLTVSIDTL